MTTQTFVTSSGVWRYESKWRLVEVVRFQTRRKKMNWKWMVVFLLLASASGMGQTQRDVMEGRSRQSRQRADEITLLRFRTIPEQSGKAVVEVSERGRVTFDIGHYSAVNFVALWDEWQDSCWADSTYRETYESAGHYMIPPSKVWRWFHRDPNDLPGFMEFVRRKVTP